MTQDKTIKEFWIYKGKRNCEPLIFAYLKEQSIKREAPENFDEYQVITMQEHKRIVDGYEKIIAELEGALKNFTRINDYGATSATYPITVSLARQALQKLKGFRGDLEKCPLCHSTNFGIIRDMTSRRKCSTCHTEWECPK